MELPPGLRCRQTGPLWTALRADLEWRAAIQLQRRAEERELRTISLGACAVGKSRKLQYQTDQDVGRAVGGLPPVGVAICCVGGKPQDIRHRHRGQQRNIRIARRGAGRRGRAGSELLVQGKDWSRITAAKSFGSSFGSPKLKESLSAAGISAVLTAGLPIRSTWRNASGCPSNFSGSSK